MGGIDEYDTTTGDVHIAPENDLFDIDSSMISTWLDVDIT